MIVQCMRCNASYNLFCSLKCLLKILDRLHFSSINPILYSFKNSENFQEKTRLDNKHFLFRTLLLNPSRFFPDLTAKQITIFNLPETGKLSILTSSMHISKSTKPKFMKFKQKLVPLILYNFNIEHFSILVHFSHEMTTTR